MRPVKKCTQPKSVYPSLEMEWNNFLLAYANCISIKGDRDPVLTDYY